MLAVYIPNAPKGAGQLRSARAALAKIESADIGHYSRTASLIGRNETSITMIVDYTYEGLLVKAQPNGSVMRHPQDDLLIVYAQSMLAQEHRGTPKKNGL